MHYTRLFGSLALAAGISCLAGQVTPSFAQVPSGIKDAYRKEAPRPGTEVSSAITQMRDGKLEVGIDPPEPEGPKHKEYLKKTAEFLIFPVTHSEFYTESIEMNPGARKQQLGLPERDNTLDGVLSELERYVVVPDARSKAPSNQSEYIQEFGKALDAAIGSILNDKSKTPPPVKLNAVRALAVACKSGARAHAKTVLALLTDEKVPLYLKVPALKAAENLLAAGDMRELQGPNPYKHSIPDADLAALVNAIEAIIDQMNKTFEPAEAAPVKATKPGTPPAPGKLEPALPAAQPLDPAVALYIRKLAVQALSKVRVASIPGPNHTTAARPGVTLARIAIGDPRFTGGGTVAELTDAVSGLATMHFDSSINMDVLLDAIAAGVSTVGGLKASAGSPSNPDYKKYVPWKKTAAQLNTALNTLQTSPDKNPVAAANRSAIGTLVSTCTTYVLQPIEADKNDGQGTTVPVDPARVSDYRKQNARKSDLLLRNDGESKVTLPNQRAAGR